MADWRFLKKPEFWVTTIIAIILTFVGGFLIGQSYVINGDFAELQNEYNLLNSSYNKLIVQNSQGNIVTQNQQGNNLLINPEKTPRKLDEATKSQLSNMLSQFTGNKIELHYLNGDKEAFNFATEIKVYLDSQSWDITEPMPTTWFGEPYTGVMIVPPEKGGLTINVYGQE